MNSLVLAGDSFNVLPSSHSVSMQYCGHSGLQGGGGSRDFQAGTSGYQSTGQPPGQQGLAQHHQQPQALHSGANGYMTTTDNRIDTGDLGYNSFLHTSGGVATAGPGGVLRHQPHTHAHGTYNNNLAGNGNNTLLKSQQQHHPTGGYPQHPTWMANYHHFVNSG